MKPLDIQIGGNHYKNLAIQPMEFSLSLELNAAKHTAIKYVTRFESKGGQEDLKKATHCIEILRQYWFENDYQDDMCFADLVAVTHYCAANNLSPLQTKCITLVVMANDHDDLNHALEHCYHLVSSINPDTPIEVEACMDLAGAKIEDWASHVATDANGTRWQFGCRPKPVDIDASWSAQSDFFSRIDTVAPPKDWSQTLIEL